MIVDMIKRNESEDEVIEIDGDSGPSIHSDKGNTGTNPNNEEIDVNIEVPIPNDLVPNNGGNGKKYLQKLENASCRNGIRFLEDRDRWQAF